MTRTTACWAIIGLVVMSLCAGCQQQRKRPTAKQRAPEQKPIPRVPHGSKIGEVRINEKDGAAMLWVPAGEFIRGSTDQEIAEMLPGNPDYVEASWSESEKPQRRIHLDGYWIYKYEVTVAQYRKFCHATGRSMPTPDALDGAWKDSHPIESMTWQDAADYAQWAGCTLPTEAEWEKAARGTDGRIYPWGNKWDSSKCANSAKRELKESRPIGSYPSGASPYGVMDMAGNAIEWCSDWYDEDETYYANCPADNPPGPEGGVSRILRGGSWDYYSAAPTTFRCAARGGAKPDKGTLGGSTGFRCVIKP